MMICDMVRDTSANPRYGQLADVIIKIPHREKWPLEVKSRQWSSPAWRILVMNEQAWIVKMSGIRIFRIYFEKSPKIR